MKFSFYLRKPLARKKQYNRIFFRLLLFALYFVFFIVQVFLRLTSPESQQFLGTGNYQKPLAPKSSNSKNIISKANPGKKNPSSYLNKRYHPKDSVAIPSREVQLCHFYSEISSKFYSDKDYTPHAKINSGSLRGPPNT
jgi:hypothetical protein